MEMEYKLCHFLKGRKKGQNGSTKPLVQVAVFEPHQVSSHEDRLGGAYRQIPKVGSPRDCPIGICFPNVCAMLGDTSS